MSAVFHNEERHNEERHSEERHREGYGHNERHGLDRLEQPPSFQSQLARSVPRDVSPRLHDLGISLTNARR